MTKLKLKRPKNDREAYEQILQHVSRAEIAEHLGLSRQLVSRWKTVPRNHALAVCEFTQLPLSYVLPELDHAVSALLNRPAEPLLPELIRLLS